MGVGFLWGLDGKCSGEDVLTGDGCGVSFGTRSGINGYSVTNEG